MKNIIAIISLTIMLSGCASEQMQAQEQKMSEYQSCGQYKKFVASAACTKKIADADTVLLPDNTNLQELVSLKEVLAERISAKKITEAEAWLEYNKRKNELANQEAQTKALQHAASRSKRTRTTCTGFGDQINCNTY